MTQTTKPTKPTTEDFANAKRMLTEYDGWHEALTWRQQIGCDDPPGVVEAVRILTKGRTSAKAG